MNIFYFGAEERNKILRDAMAIMWGGNPAACSETIRNRWRKGFGKNNGSPENQR